MTCQNYSNFSNNCPAGQKKMQLVKSILKYSCVEVKMKQKVKQQCLQHPLHHPHIPYWELDYTHLCRCLAAYSLHLSTIFLSNIFIILIFKTFMDPARHNKHFDSSITMYYNHSYLLSFCTEAHQQSFSSRLILD